MLGSAKLTAMNIEQQYWIQEKAPAGNYFDSIGLPKLATQAMAIAQLKSWQEEFPDRKVRLIMRLDIPVLH